MFLPTLRVPAFTENLISVGQIPQKYKLIFKKDYVTYPKWDNRPPSRQNYRSPHGTEHLRCRRRLQGRHHCALHTKHERKNKTCTKKGTAHVRRGHPCAKQPHLHIVLNHNCALVLTRFQQFYPATTSIVIKLPHTHQESQCVLYILCKASRRPIPKPALHLANSRKEPQDANSTDATGRTSPPDANGHR